MKFQLAINLERMDPSLDMREVARHTLEMVQMAEEGGFSIAWAAEHHALEMTIAPNPFQILTWWAEHTSTIRLGTACVVAPYWHPVKVAGEAAFLDLISGGRLEFGIGSGAYQREFDRMAPGLKQSEGWQYMQEMLPVVRALWKGDHAHDGQFWSFPTSTSCPKPLQPEVPVWVAARAPVTYDYAVREGCNIMSWPLTRGMDEAQTYVQRLEDALAAHPGKKRPTMAMMRHTAVYDRKDEWMAPVRAAQRQLSQFENLFKNLGDVTDGFPREIPLESVANRAEYDPQMLSANLMFGTPDEVIAKLKPYQALGVDAFIYYASMGYGLAEQKRSLELFCKHVIPAFK
ncbi:LLM class flavin-dependent oxidoreductase [Pseudogemmobacter humi]|uniref:Alkanal monooxygenase alpha chain n=1 Tax=Pseudogemmobacter humi TaxID=2483812 RepID=A0A3P5X949_9RHOB|nr:LLM class flavin-dependent oxidoreductase [Pseudogemmobacter humi]VDC24927.1 Alkanal monooxygenase alpha chain [Pseudogemmobacter humi]